MRMGVPERKPYVHSPWMLALLTWVAKFNSVALLYICLAPLLDQD